MRILETARVILNKEEVDDFCEKIQKDRPELKTWPTTQLKNWILKKGPAKPSELQVENLPEWLKKDTQNADLDEVKTIIDPVLDYLSSMVEERPSFKLQNVGVDAAITNSKKWHESLAKKKPKEAPVVGTVFLKLDNGFYWTELQKKDELKAEGENMGHCVGRSYYRRKCLMGELRIFSLRSRDGVSHVTLDTSPDLSEVTQIKGKANLPVIEEYLPYVFEFLKKVKPSRILFDGAAAIKPEFLKWLKETSKSYDGYKVYVHGQQVFVNNEAFYALTALLSNTKAANAVAAFWKENPNAFNRDTVRLIQIEWFAPAANNLSKMLYGDPKAVVCYGGYIAQGNVYLTFRLDNIEETDDEILDRLRDLPAATSEHTGYEASTSVFIDGEKSSKWTVWVHARYSKKLVNEESGVDSLLKALKAPSIADIQKTASEQPSDELFTQAGIKIAGTPGMATPLVLALALNRNRDKAKAYLHERTNAFKNWSAIMQNEPVASFVHLGITPENNKPLYEELQEIYKRLA